MAGPDLLRLHAEHSELVFEISLWVLGVLALLIAALKLLVWNRKSPLHKYELVRLNVQLGNVGSVELRPNNEDVQIAHRIWTELMTRKAAQPIDIEHDVIIEIYDLVVCAVWAHQAVDLGYSGAHAAEKKRARKN